MYTRLFRNVEIAQTVPSILHASDILGCECVDLVKDALNTCLPGCDRGQCHCTLFASGLRCFHHWESKVFSPLNGFLQRAEAVPPPAYQLQTCVQILIHFLLPLFSFFFWQATRWHTGRLFVARGLGVQRCVSCLLQKAQRGYWHDLHLSARLPLSLVLNSRTSFSVLHALHNFLSLVC